MARPKDLRSAHPLLALPELVRRRGLITAADTAEFGIWRTYLQEYAESGVLVRVARGVYTTPDNQPSAAAVACKCVRRGVLCLLSALHIHGLIPCEPRTVWMALGPKERRPKLQLPVRFFRFSGPSLTSGIEEVVGFGAAKVRVYSLEKTIADCFKFRNKIGPRIAVGALERALQHRQCNLKQLREFAAICRVSRIIEPHLLSLGAAGA